MKKSFETLALDHYPHIYKFLELSDLNNLKKTSHFLQDNVELYLKNSTVHTDTLNIRYFILFAIYLNCLQSDFPILSGAQPSALPYLNTVATVPPMRSIFHRVINIISAYPTESSDFIAFSIPHSIDHLRHYTREISLILQNHLNIPHSNPEQIARLSHNLHQYKHILLKILDENQKTSKRSPYLENIKHRTNALAICFSMTLYTPSSALFSSNSNYFRTITALTLLSLIFKSCDLFFIASCKSHLKTHYPGLVLSNDFLNKKLFLFKHFFENANTHEEIISAFTKKLSDASTAIKKLNTLPNTEQPLKPMDLFFYYQHHHHPHTFKTKADEKESKKNSVKILNKIYSTFSKIEAMRKKSRL